MKKSQIKEKPMLTILIYLCTKSDHKFTFLFDISISLYGNFFIEIKEFSELLESLEVLC